MKSLAIWTENSKIEIEDLHINVWKLPCEKNKINDDFYRFIDFGFKFDLNNQEEDNQTETNLKFNIFYPQRIVNNDIEDLVGKLYENIESKLISTLFNDNLNLSIDSNKDFAKVTNGDSTNDFYTYKIKATKIKISNKFSGSVLEFDIKIPTEYKKIYLRFRIKKDYKDIFSTIDKPSNAILQSQFSKTELFNFRINEVRDISNDVLEEINNSKLELSNFKKIHIFYICSAKDEYMYSHKNYDGVRILERSKWKTYIDDSKLNEKSQILAYHFKEKCNPKNDKASTDTEIKTGIMDYNFLIQTKYEINNRNTIFYYLGILFLITLCFNLISNAVWENLNSIVNSFKYVILSLVNFLLNISVKALILLLIILIIPIFIVNLKRIKYYGNSIIKSIFNRKK